MFITSPHNLKMSNGRRKRSLLTWAIKGQSGNITSLNKVCENCFINLQPGLATSWWSSGKLAVSTRMARSKTFVQEKNDT